VVANVIRGKHKPSFTPNVDCGDNVIIINADKVRLTGKKWTDRKMSHYTGYPGGLRTITPRELQAKFPERLVEKAVRGMLPKTRLGRKLFNHLYVYAGETHPHEAQQPKKLELQWK
jgi:large subunit ribosomal protein L13